jgi:hypothetical protein
MASITTTSAVYASSAPVVLDLEGNPSCSALALNTVFEEKDTSVSKHTEELPLLLHNGQELTYTVGPDNTIESWKLHPTAVLPALRLRVNFVILKGSGNAGARVFHYVKGGVTEDSTLVGPGTLKTVSFCYGIEEPFIEETVTLCPVIGVNSIDPPPELLGVVVQCPDNDTDYSIHIIKKGTDGFEYDECTCNAEAKTCDPELAADETGACVAACDPLLPESDYLTCLEDNQLREAPGAIVPWNNGSGWCTSVLGSIRCRTW